jgi:hypothetical protein
MRTCDCNLFEQQNVRISGRLFPSPFAENGFPRTKTGGCFPPSAHRFQLVPTFGGANSAHNQLQIIFCLRIAWINAKGLTAETQCAGHVSRPRERDTPGPTRATKLSWVRSMACVKRVMPSCHTGICRHVSTVQAATTRTPATNTPTSRPITRQIHVSGRVTAICFERSAAAKLRPPGGSARHRACARRRSKKAGRAARRRRRSTSLRSEIQSDLIRRAAGAVRRRATRRKQQC